MVRPICSRIPHKPLGLGTPVHLICYTIASIHLSPGAIGVIVEDYGLNDHPWYEYGSGSVHLYVVKFPGLVPEHHPIILSDLEIEPLD